MIIIRIKNINTMLVQKLPEMESINSDFIKTEIKRLKRIGIKVTRESIAEAIGVPYTTFANHLREPRSFAIPPYALVAAFHYLCYIEKQYELEMLRSRIDKVKESIKHI
ncbi:MAG TPA: hypothetical protein DCS93_18440 [Microscillaceae bacterium]|nr:hypothetical protein [Microscillaceae bacterium]